MKYDVISADGHIDLIWLPTDLFTKNASGQMKERMPYVIEGPKGPEWTSRNGAKFGLVNGMGSAGREYVPGITAVRQLSKQIQLVRIFVVEGLQRPVTKQLV